MIDVFSHSLCPGRGDFRNIAWFVKYTKKTHLEKFNFGIPLPLTKNFQSASTSKLSILVATKKPASRISEAQLAEVIASWIFFTVVMF